MPIIKSEPGGSMEELRKSVYSMAVDITVLQTENAALKAQVAALKAQVESAEAQAASERVGLAARIIRESAERVRADRNVMVFGLPESSGLSPQFRAHEDEVALLNVFCSIAVPMAGASNIIRIGSDYANKPRPLKLVFPRREDAKSLISGYNMARRTGTRVPWDMHVCRDRTWLERKVLREAYAELKRRKRAGETNLVVSTFNSVPKVTTRKQPF